MSNVRSKDRKPHRFRVTDDALALYKHTLLITSNENIFIKRYEKLTDSITYEAAMIYHCCRVANEEYSNKVYDQAIKRLELQEEAFEHCRNLKTYILLAEGVFHLRANKVIYWNKLLNKTRKSIISWNHTEIDNFKTL